LDGDEELAACTIDAGKDTPFGSVGKEGASSFDMYGASSHHSFCCKVVASTTSFPRREKQSKAFAAAAFIACFSVSVNDGSSREMPQQNK